MGAGKYTKGENPEKLQWDFFQDIWNKGPGDSQGSVRVQLIGGAPPAGSEVAIDPLLVRAPLNLDGSGNLRVVMGAGTFPIYGAAPNDYIQVFEMAPVTGQYFVAPADLGNGNAALALLDIKRRLKINISEFSSPTPLDVNVTGGTISASDAPIDVAATGQAPGDYSYNPGGAANGARITGLLMRFDSSAAKAVSITVGDGVTEWTIDSISTNTEQEIHWTPPEGALDLPQSCTLKVSHTVNNMDIRVLGYVT